MNGQEFLELGILMSGEDGCENAGFIPRYIPSSRLWSVLKPTHIH